MDGSMPARDREVVTRREVARRGRLRGFRRDGSPFVIAPFGRGVPPGRRVCFAVGVRMDGRREVEVRRLMPTRAPR